MRKCDVQFRKTSNCRVAAMTWHTQPIVPWYYCETIRLHKFTTNLFSNWPALPCQKKLHRKTIVNFSMKKLHRCGTFFWIKDLQFLWFFFSESIICVEFSYGSFTKSSNALILFLFFCKQDHTSMNVSVSVHSFVEIEFANKNLLKQWDRSQTLNFFLHWFDEAVAVACMYVRMSQVWKAHEVATWWIVTWFFFLLRFS